MVSGGGDIPVVSKTMTSSNANCIVCWEGDTSYMYPLVQDLVSMLDSSPRLSSDLAKHTELQEAIIQRLNRFVNTITNVCVSQEKPDVESFGTLLLWITVGASLTGGPYRDLSISSFACVS